MSENYFDQLINFTGKFLKFALLTFTGAFIIAGIVWILYAIFEWICIGISYLKDVVREENVSYSGAITYNNSSTKCPNCHLQIPSGPRCNICGARLKEEQKLIPYPEKKDKNKSDNLDDAEVSVIQYSERKKYQKIRCPYCDSLSKVIQEKDHGVQTRRCRNSHIFMYDYESEMLIQSELNAKYN